MLASSRSVLGAKLPPLFIPMPIEATLEIDDCHEFALAQLLYEQRAVAESGPPGVRESVPEAADGGADGGALLAASCGSNVVCAQSESR